MNGLLDAISPSLLFVKLNIGYILAIPTGVVIFYLLYRISVITLRKLKIEIFQSYPFDMFIPKSGEWSVGYFIIIVLLLVLLTFFIVKGNFYPTGPA